VVGNAVFSNKQTGCGQIPGSNKSIFRSLRSPSTLRAPSRSPIVLELVLVLAFFSPLRPTLFPHQKSLLPVEKRPRTSTTEVRGEPTDFGRQRRHSRFQTSSRRRHRLDCPIPNRLLLERADGQLLPSAVGTAVRERPPERF
jgi:hypothetical protein